MESSSNGRVPLAGGASSYGGIVNELFVDGPTGQFHLWSLPLYVIPHLSSLIYPFSSICSHRNPLLSIRLTHWNGMRSHSLFTAFSSVFFPLLRWSSSLFICLIFPLPFGMDGRMCNSDSSPSTSSVTVSSSATDGSPSSSSQSPPSHSIPVVEDFVIRGHFLTFVLHFFLFCLVRIIAARSTHTSPYLYVYSSVSLGRLTNCLNGYGDRLSLYHFSSVWSFIVFLSHTLPSFTACIFLSISISSSTILLISSISFLSFYSLHFTLLSLFHPFYCQSKQDLDVFCPVESKHSMGFIHSWWVVLLLVNISPF